jgi:hypothetical protein
LNTNNNIKYYKISSYITLYNLHLISNLFYINKIKLYNKFILFSYIPLYKQILINTILYNYLKYNWYINLYNNLFLNKFIILNNIYFYFSNIFKNIEYLNDIIFSLNIINDLFEIKQNKITSYYISKDDILNISIYYKKYDYTIGLFEINLKYINFFLKIYLYKTISDNQINYILNNSFEIIYAGQVLSTGTFNINKIIKYLYYNNLNYFNYYISSYNSLIYIYMILTESLLIQYNLQGIKLNKSNFEIIIKKMISFVQIFESGHTTLLKGDIINLQIINLINRSYIKNGMFFAKFTPIILGLIKLTLLNTGFLTSASFQNTIKILINAALNKYYDWLIDLKSNIINSIIIPISSGWFEKFR